MSTGSVINAEHRLALVERIACHTVGIAANDNTCVGTGTLVAIDEYHLVITAEHVIKDADVRKHPVLVQTPCTDHREGS